MITWGLNEIIYIKHLVPKRHWIPGESFFYTPIFYLLRTYALSPGKFHALKPQDPFPNFLSLGILKSSDLCQLYSISIIYLGNGIIITIYYASTYWNGTAVAAEWGYATFSEKPSPTPSLCPPLPLVSSFLYAPQRCMHAFNSIIVCWMNE